MGHITLGFVRSNGISEPSPPINFFSLNISTGDGPIDRLGRKSEMSGHLKDRKTAWMVFAPGGKDQVDLAVFLDVKR